MDVLYRLLILFSPGFLFVTGIWIHCLISNHRNNLGLGRIVKIQRNSIFGHGTCEILSFKTGSVYEVHKFRLAGYKENQLVSLYKDGTSSLDFDVVTPKHSNGN